MSLALAQMVMVEDCPKYDKSKESDMTELFSRALGELDALWNKKQYANMNVESQSIKPNQEEFPYNDNDDIKEVVDKGPSASKFKEYNILIKSLCRHVTRREYYLHFHRCAMITCIHCYGKENDDWNDVFDNFPQKNIHHYLNLFLLMIYMKASIMPHSWI